MIIDPAVPRPEGVAKTIQKTAPSQATEPSGDHLGDHLGDRQVHPVGYRPLDWGAAVRAAAVLLDGGIHHSTEMANPALTPMAQDLAARLCAYSSGEGTHPFVTKPPSELHPQSGHEPTVPASC